MQRAEPSVAPGDLRAALAHFVLGGSIVDRPLGGLSGGERFRISLATLPLADPPNQLLVLDEPTNNLDRRSIDLVAAWSAYHGGLVVVSHDDGFLHRLRVGRWISMDDRSLHLDDA